MKEKFWKGKKILVTGGAGFLGSFAVEKLIKERGVAPENIRIPRSRDIDLRVWEKCVKVVKNIDIVIHIAGRGGGIGYNRKCPGTLFYDNIVMNTQLMEAARQEGVEKFVCIGTVCAYPKYASVPFKEENLWEDYPEETNAAYGLAKKMMLVQSQAYRQQYGFKSIHLLMVNLYGPRDNFSPEASHVISALIKKIFDAKESGENYITVWGTGRATREFLYVGDAAEGIILATEKYNKPDPVNLGSGFEISIKELVELIAELAGFDGVIRWDTSKPDGQPRRCLDVSRAREEFGFVAKVDFREGLEKTIEWYKKVLLSGIRK
jgi:GDP-L-fucose synthase